MPLQTLPTNWADNIGMIENAAFLNKVGANANIAVYGKDNSGDRTLTLWVGTQAQYDAIATKDANTVYVVTA